MRAGLFAALRDAFARTGIPWESCHIEDRGDGAFIAVPAGVPKHIFVYTLPNVLARRLRGHNRTHRAEMEIRLRMAVHAGEVHFDDHGVAGASINHAFRLIEMPELKSAVRKSIETPLALITSEWFYAEVVSFSTVIAPNAHRPVEVRAKETRTRGWIYLPGEPPSPRQE